MPPAGPDLVYFTDVYPSFAIAAVGPGPFGNHPPHLLLSTDFGRTFSDFGPSVPSGWIPDSAFFLDRQHGWFAVWSLGVPAERIYRTDDGGRTWRWSTAPGHNMSSCSSDTAQFVNDGEGWLADDEPVGPVETLYRSLDAGQTWTAVANLRAGTLPNRGDVEFNPAGTLGWLADGYGQILYETRDGGLTWRPSTLPHVPEGVVGLPFIGGSTLVEPVTVTSADSMNDPIGSLILYRSDDNGLHWRQVSQLPVGLSDGCVGEAASVSILSPNVIWVAVIDKGHVTVDITADGGKHWAVRTVPATASLDDPPQIQAADGIHAWLFSPAGVSQNGYAVWSTVDGGARWQRIDQRMSVAAH